MKKSVINITDVLTGIIRDITVECPVFSHIDIDRIMICVASNRSGSRGGTYGKVVPMKFEKGSSLLKHRGRVYTMPAIEHQGKTCLYIIYFFMPRFFDLPAGEKLRVIFHELYHVSPDFNGDIRRMGKKKAAHGSSKKHFDSHFEEALNKYLELLPRRECNSFLSMSSRELYAAHQRIIGRRMKVPKPIMLQKN